jgi:predicted Zn-dependent protease
MMSTTHYYKPGPIPLNFIMFSSPSRYVQRAAARLWAGCSSTWLAAVLVAATLLAAAPISRAIPSELPDIGDASATTLSPEQEARIGTLMMRHLRRNHQVLDDPELTQYIQSLGHQLSSYTGSDQPFTFFVVDDDTINAFAMPGGYIGVNAGLIVASESENELASVLAHEISHVTQHHLARSYEKANKMNLPMTAAVIAAILLGAHDPQAGQAALAASMAGSAQMQLDFTRANEQEADRVGIQLLAQSGFDPRGMAAFFERLQKETRYYGNGLPEFLSTHPVTTARIAEAEDRSAQYPHVTHRDSESYHAIKAILRVHESRDRNDLAERTADNIKSGRYNNLTEEQFTHALALQSIGQYPQAVTELQRLLKHSPGRIAFMKALADTQFMAGNQPEGLSIYRKGLDLYPGNTVLTLGYADTLLKAQQPMSAATLLQTYTRNNPTSIIGFQLLATAAAASGNDTGSHLAYAEYYALQSELHSAIDQLNLALKAKSNDFYLTSLIESRLQQLKQQEQQQKLDTVE